MKRNRKFWIALAVAAALAVLAGGCGTDRAHQPEEDGPQVIQMYGNLDETYIPFLNALAEQFPEVDLRYEFQWDIAGVTEMGRRILHEDGPDIAVVTGAGLTSLTEQNLLLDLTGAPFSTRYHVSTMTALNDQGRVLGLPLPNDLRSLLCNRGILQEHGITQLPTSVPELIEICRSLMEQGQGAIIMDEHIYQMLLRTSYLFTPAGYDWLQAYNDGETTMAGTPAADAWQTFETLAGVSGCRPEDITAAPARRTELMMEGAYAFRCVTVSNLKYMKQNMPQLDMVALPLLGETQEEQWVYYAEQRNMRYFVANGALAQPENEEKQDVVLRMLDWISTQEGQQILASCSSAAVSYVNDVELHQGTVMEYLDPMIELGRLTSSDTLERGVEGAASRIAAEVVSGSMTAEEAVQACDAQNAAYTPPEEKTGLDEVIGSAAATIYWRKPAAVTVGSSMTQLAAMAMAEAFPEADFAFAMAKNAATTLYAGEITMGDALACADGEGDRELMLVQVTGAQIRDLIEAGVGSPTQADLVGPYGVAGKGRLLHPVGLTYRADITREEGDKIVELTLTGGGTLEMDRTYTILVSGLLVDGVTPPNLKDCPATPTGKYLRDVLVDYIRAHAELTAPEVGFEILGAKPLYTLP